jgi:replicative DNA helicase
MSFFSDLKKEIEEGQEGKNKGYSLGMPRLDKYISLRKRMFYMIMGSSGSGKTALLHDCFMLNPLEILNQSRETDKKLKYILFSMERSKAYIHAKWLIRRIFLDTGKLIPMHILLNWYGDKLKEDALRLIDTYEDYFNYIEANIDIYEGPRSPNDMFRIVKEYAETHGEDEEISKFKKIYTPKDESIEVIIAGDHMGLTKTTKDHPTKKQAIDQAVSNFQYFRDHLGYSILAVNQLNRDLSSPIYSKLDSFEPHLDNAKETGSIVEAADVVISVFDPLRYNTNDRFYGDVNIFRCPETGHKYFRNIKILKSSYGIDDAAVGCVFHGETGHFKELAKSKFIKDNWKTEDYESIFNGSFFLQNEIT